jgi:hypothetical protein
MLPKVKNYSFKKTTKTKEEIMWRIVIVFGLALNFIGCSGTAHKTMNNSDVNYKTKSNFDPLAKDMRLIISSTDLKMKSFSPDSLHNRTISLAHRFNGYVLNSGKDFTDIRVPAERNLDAIAEIESFGETVDKKIIGKDVTEDYYDLNTRLDNAEKTRLRYLALLERADNLDKILKLEKELAQLNAKIELLKGKIQRMSHKLDYSDIHVKTIKENKPGPVSYVFMGMYEGVRWLFVRN